MRVIDSKLLDSSIWIEYLLNGSFKNIIENDQIFLSTISLFEIKKKLVKSNIPLNVITNSINFVKKKSFLVLVSAEIAEYAVELAIQNRLGAVDAIIYASALRSNSVLLTLDNDFRKLKNVEILD